MSKRHLIIACLGILAILPVSAQAGTEGEKPVMRFSQNGPVVDTALPVLIRRIPMKNPLPPTSQGGEKYFPFVNLDVILVGATGPIMFDAESKEQPVSLTITIPVAWILDQLKSLKPEKIQGIAFWYEKEKKWYRMEDLLKHAPKLPDLEIREAPAGKGEFAFTIIRWPTGDFVIGCW
jgi:hypothetical protein